MSNVNPQLVLVQFCSIIISLTIHEFAHAYVANAMGDPTPKRYGRLNLNPMTIIKAHPFGALLIPIIGAFNGFLIGWAATPVNPHLVDRKYTLRQAERWISLAGPLSNLILAFICAFLTLGLNAMASLGGELAIWIEPLFVLCQVMVLTNIFLTLFNLIPIPPFDGFTILSNTLPKELSHIPKMIEQYANILILFAFVFGGRVLSPMIYSISDTLFGIARWILTPLLG